MHRESLEQRKKHFQEIPDQSTNATTSFTWGWDSSKTSELLSGMEVSTLEKEEMDSENIPQELLSNLGHPQSPPRKRLKSKGNDKDFAIIHTPKLNRENFPLLLGIFSCLFFPEILKSLWQTVDLTGRNLYPDVVGRLLPFCLQHLDLSNSVIDVSTLPSLLSHCFKLQNLSLEDFLQLNLSGCSGFSESVAIAHMSETIIQLKLSVSTTVGRCPSLVHLDLTLSRCYDIMPETLLELGEIPTLKTLQVFGIMPDGTPQLLKEALPHLQINCPHFTTIARLTFGNKNQGIWGIKC
ncbi:hypothetical protein FD755_004450 [Muntiacus reevesi]|uniref:S-phase kinase-associated protein 2 n=1 Tax=Muntiacus reevesi TaxID=9886 RepID=A0A5J5MVH7_MUNRE|nr:hypothetical protein FD755_004450 [Muntiacus reevesi]